MATVPAGRINKLFGAEGSVMLSLYDAFPEDFDPEQTPLLVTIDALEVPLWCERFERRGVTGAVGLVRRSRHRSPCRGAAGARIPHRRARGGG